MQIASAVLSGNGWNAAGGHLKPGGVLDERLQHEAHSGQDHAAVKDAVLVERVDRHRGAGVDDHASRRKEIGRASIAATPRRAMPSGRRRVASAAHSGSCTPHAASVAVSHSGVRRQRVSCDSTRTRAASPATLTPSARDGRGRSCQARSAERADFAVGCHARGAANRRAPRRPHFIRLLPASMTRIRLNDPPYARTTPASQERGSAFGAHARRSVISPDRKRARRGPSASTKRAARIHARDLARDGRAPSGSRSRTGLPW